MTARCRSSPHERRAPATVGRSRQADAARRLSAGPARGLFDVRTGRPEADRRSAADGVKETVGAIFVLLYFS
jgi:hypothetical protein